MEHHFDVDVAEQYGIEEAIILYNLKYWLIKNIANEVNLYDGYYWTYNSTKAFSKIFPYMSEKKISRILLDLEDKGVIKSGNYNKSPYDKTKWYTIIQKCLIDCSFLSNREDINVQPIPDNNTDNNISSSKEEDNNVHCSIKNIEDKESNNSHCSIILKEEIKNKGSQVFQNIHLNLECDCISKSTNLKCKRKSTYNIDGINYCNQHSREKMGEYINENKKKKDEIENRDEVFENLWKWYSSQNIKKQTAKDSAKSWFNKLIKTNYDLNLLRYSVPKYIESVSDKTFIVLLRTYLSEKRYLDYKNEFDEFLEKNKDIIIEPIQEQNTIESPKEELKDDDIIIKKRNYDN